MLIGKHMSALANSPHASERERAAIQSALRPVIEQCQHDCALILTALGGPDPEFALSLLVDALGDLPARMGALDDALGLATRLRLVA